MFEMSNAERLVIQRRRKGITQQRAAEVYGVCLTVYSLWERDLHTHIPKVLGVEDIQPHEMCFLLRRRKGWTQVQTAQRVKCSIEWLKRMERGTAKGNKLFKFWGI